jgi:putative ABC transport system permease protein
MKLLQQSWRMLARDWRAGELRLLLVAVALAVAALSSVGFFADRMSKALSSQARQLLGADAVLNSDVPVGQEFRAAAKKAGLTVADTVVFPSMVGATGPKALEVAPQLSSLKAVSAGYPLRGNLKVSDKAGELGADTREIPAPGTVWLDPALLSMLNASIGDSVELGELQLKVTRLITMEPDRGTNFVNFAPRALINLQDLERSRLVQTGSRVGYRVLLSGDLPTVDAFVASQKIATGQRFEDLRGGRPELRSTLDRAERFLSLVALLSALIAATAIALAARRFAERHLDGCAVMRAIGLPQGQMARLLLLELVWIAMGAAIVGVVIGYAAHYALISAVGSLLTIALPQPSLAPAVQSSLAGLVLLLGFAGLPIVRLAGVAPIRVLRRDLGAPGQLAWISGGIAFVAVMALMVWFAGDLKLAGIALGGFVAAALVFALVAWGLMRLVASAGRASKGRALAMLRVVLAGWSKRGVASIAQMVALAVSLMALLLLTVTRNDLLDSWRKASPPDAPNRFVINIQPDQRDSVAQALKKAGLTGGGSANAATELAPMVRGRLVRINGQEVNLELFNERAKRMLDREFNVSYMTEQPGHNTTTQGRWINPAAAEVSIEEGMAATLNLKLNDDLAFDIAGEITLLKVVGFRKVVWDSMKVNFFMVASPKPLLNAPQTFVTALHVPAEKRQAVDQLVRTFPNLTVFDTDNILKQVQTVLDQISRAVEFLFGFTLLAGLLVLYAAQSAGQQERQRETALMRALGASRDQLTKSLSAELLLTGGLAGLMAGVGAVTVGVVLARTIFEFNMGISLWPILVGVIAGSSAALLAGWWGLRKIVQTPPMISLRME